MPVFFLVISNKRSTLYNFILFPGRHIYPNSDADVDKDYYDICSEQIDESLKNFFFKILIMIFSFVMSVAWPLYLFLTHGIKSTLLQTKVPFVDENSDDELLVNFVLECLLGVYGFTAHFSLEICVSICTDFVRISRKLLEHRLRKILKRHQTKHLCDKKLFAEFKEIVDHIQEFERYTT